MNAKQLRELLKDVPDETQVFVSGPDHSYRIARAQVLSVAKETLTRGVRYSEWTGSVQDYTLPVESTQGVVVT